MLLDLAKVTTQDIQVKPDKSWSVQMRMRQKVNGIKQPVSISGGTVTMKIKRQFSSEAASNLSIGSGIVVEDDKIVITSPPLKSGTYTYELTIHLADTTEYIIEGTINTVNAK